jgi:putative transposase
MHYAGTMARLPRIQLPNVPLHIVQRGHNRMPCFTRPGDFRHYLTALSIALEEYECALHAYALMTNHVHLLLTPADPATTATFFMSVGSRYVHYFNSMYGRTGALWENRYYCAYIETEQYLMRCYRYIDLNPLLANTVTNPADYPWSSYGHNALGLPNPLVTPHSVYQRMKNAAMPCHTAYQTLCEQALNPAELVAIRRALRRGTTL